MATDLTVEYQTLGSFAPDLAHPRWWDTWAKAEGPYACYVLTYKTVPTAVVRLFRRQLTYPGLIQANCLGIGGVFTREESRGRGYASRLLSNVIEDQRFKHILVGLYSTRPATLYTNLGFIRLSDFHGGLYVRVLPPYRLFVLPNDAWKLETEAHF